jgi:hypothetical protein
MADSNPMMTFYSTSSKPSVPKADKTTRSRDRDGDTPEPTGTPSAPGSDKQGQTLANLFKQLPAEATGVYLLGFDMFKDNDFMLIVSLVVGLAALLMVRIMLKASRGVLISSSIAYLLWVYAIGSGPFQLLLENASIAEPDGLGTFMITVYTTFVTILANNGKLK